MWKGNLSRGPVGLDLQVLRASGLGTLACMWGVLIRSGEGFPLWSMLPRTLLFTSTSLGRGQATAQPTNHWSWYKQVPAVAHGPHGATWLPWA